jgi:response regulator RpfG family c-di-GMP phosphodiesterase
LPKNVLVVAGPAGVRESLSAGLRERGFQVTLAVSGAEALRTVTGVAVDFAIIESHLPDIRAEQLQARLKEARPDCRVLTLASYGIARATPELLSLGPGDYILREENLLGLLDAATPSDAAAKNAAPASGEPAQPGATALIQTIDVLVGLLELSDRFFGGGTHQVARLVRAVAEDMRCDARTLEEILLATLLRDIGRAGLERTVLDEEQIFEDGQRERMRSHVTGSLRLLEHIDFPWKIVPIIRHHHERYDGTGYPEGLRGREIPIGARVVAAVDAYVAMVSERPHRPSLPPDVAQDELMRQAGRQFDPEVVEILLRVLEKGRTAGEGRKKPFVLVVDPDEEFRNLLRMRLLNEAMDVEAVPSAEGALERIASNPPDLVLAQVENESSDSYRLLQMVREDQALRHVPFALLSAREDRIFRVRALRLGVDEFLARSSSLEEIVARVENILVREAARRDGGAAPRRRGITGHLEVMPLADIVQTLSVGQKTACVTLSGSGKEGVLWFEEGNIRHASCGKRKGEKAFYEMLRWKAGEFVIEHNLRTDEKSVMQDAMFLLMEGFRLIDESSELAARSPA